jgi:hypothetical protein
MPFGRPNPLPVRVRLNGGRGPASYGYRPRCAPSRLHAKVPFFPFRGLIHFGVALVFFILRRTRRSDDRRIGKSEFPW